MTSEKDPYPKILEKQLKRWQEYKKNGDTNYLAAIKLLCQYSDRFSFYIPGVSYLEQISRGLHLKYRHNVNPVSKTLDEHDRDHNLTLNPSSNMTKQTVEGLLETLTRNLRAANTHINQEGDLHAIIDVIREQCQISLSNSAPHANHSSSVSPIVSCYNQVLFNPNILETDPILFYHTGQQYDYFSNVTLFNVTMCLEGKYICANSTEALYQGMKGYIPGSDHSPELKQNALQLMKNSEPPGSHLQLAGKMFNANLANTPFHLPLTPNSSMTVKEALMIDLLLMKVTQHVALAAQLLMTDGRDIIENTKLNTSYDDSFWGNGWEGNGQNRLGLAWMVVRKILQDELKATGQIQMRFELSAETCRALGLPDTRYQVHDLKIQCYDLPGVKSLLTTQEIRQYTATVYQPYNPVLLAETKISKNFQHYTTRAIETEYPSISDVQVSEASDGGAYGWFYFRSKEEANAFSIKATSSLLFNSMPPTKRFDDNTQQHIVILDSIGTKSIFIQYNLFYNLGIDLCKELKRQHQRTAGYPAESINFNL